jgi:hypothetical protein
MGTISARELLYSCAVEGDVPHSSSKSTQRPSTTMQSSWGWACMLSGSLTARQAMCCNARLVAVNRCNIVADSTGPQCLMGGCVKLLVAGMACGRSCVCCGAACVGVSCVYGVESFVLLTA